MAFAAPSPTLVRLLVAGAVAAGVALAAAATPSDAAPSDALLVAELAAPPARALLVSSNVAWQCQGATCWTRTPLYSAPAKLCVRLAKDAGAVTHFSVRGDAFDGARLAACNADAAQ